jgi:serine/threonine protein kinase
MTLTSQGLAEHRAALGNLEYLSDGGQSTIYQLPGYSMPNAPGPFVYKEYHKHLGQIPGHGLASVIAVRESLDTKERQWLDGCTVWPLRVVVDRGGAVTGVIMRLIPDEFFQQLTLRSGRTARLPREAQHLFVQRSRCEQLGWPYAEPRQRLQLCAQLSYTLAFLHRRDIVFGDISPRNVLFRLKPSVGMMLVDCDAIRKVGTAAVVGQGNTPDWFPPEGRMAPQSVRTDRYKLGLFILRVLSPGPGSSVNRDPDVVWNTLDPTGLRLLRSSLSPDPFARTDARTWYFYLRSLLGSSG